MNRGLSCPGTEKMARHTVSLCLLSMLVCIETADAAFPQPFNAKLYGRPYLVARVEVALDLSRTGDYFKFTMYTKGRAPFLEIQYYDCSVMAVRNGQLYPVEHKHADKYSPRHDAHTRFDWNARTADVAFGDGRQTRVTGLVWPTWDPISLTFQVMTDLLNGSLDNERVYRLLELGEQSDWPLRPEGVEPVETRFGEVPAVKVARPHGKTYRVWFSRSHQFIPAKIELKHGTATLISNPADAHKKSAPASAEAPRC